MLRFSWTFSPGALAEGVSDFTLGDLTIQGDQGISTSAGRTPNQSMMVFLSMLTLLDGVRNYLKTPAKQPFIFYAADSSYSFRLITKAADQLRIDEADRPIAVVSQSTLVQAIWKGVQEVLAMPTIDSGSAAEDLSAACIEFCKAFPELLPMDMTLYQELNVWIKMGLDLIQKRIDQNPDFRMLFSVQNQFLLIRQYLQRGMTLPVNDRQRLTLGLLAVREFEDNDPEMAEAMFQVSYLVDQP